MSVSWLFSFFSLVLQSCYCYCVSTTTVNKRLRTHTKVATAGLRADREEFGHHGGCRIIGNVGEIDSVPCGQDAFVAGPEPVDFCAIDGL